MRRSHLTILAAAAAGLIAVWLCWKPTGEGALGAPSPVKPPPPSKPADEPPPVVRPRPPKLVRLPKSVKLPQDNRLCLICHMNFAENDAITDHLSQRVTCIHCHGISMDHMNDESAMTPPDVLYGRIEVDCMCKQCHRQGHKNPNEVQAFRDKWAGDKRENGRNVTKTSVCTDCHGRHTVPRR